MPDTPTLPDSNRRDWLAGSAAWLGGLAGWGSSGERAQAESATLPRGQPTPAFELDGIAGRLHSDSLRGELVYLDFWASWCLPCRQSFPWMNELQARHAARGLRVVAINVDRERAAAEAFLRDQPARFTVLFDPAGETARSHRVPGMPTSMLIDPQGLLLSRHIGFRMDDRALLEERVRAALPR
jgi:thiol-disulfide isomerase/thioredoxin